MKRFSNFLTGVIMALVIVMAGCKPTAPTADTAKFLKMARDFVFDQSLPMEADTITTKVEITASNLREEAKKVVNDMTSVDFTTSPATVTKFKDFSTPAILDSVTTSIIDYGLIETGDVVVTVEWTTTDGTKFTTLGVQDKTEEPKYESMMYFNAVDMSASADSAMPGSWTWGPFTNVRVNGFGSECVRVEWTVKIQTSDCLITDPAPHIEITKEGVDCWAWTQKTSKGELAYCSPEVNCVCSKDEQNKEDCIKWVVVNYWANGFANVKVEAGVKGEFSGVELDTKVTLEGARIGIAKKRETIRNLCAKTGSKKN